jgi:hypothetical protein
MMMITDYEASYYQKKKTGHFPPQKCGPQVGYEVVVFLFIKNCFKNDCFCLFY